MLILARREGERVVIGGDVTVTVMEITGQTVRLGIAGPDDMPIYREEIWLAVQAENQAASEASAALLQSAAGPPASSPPAAKAKAGEDTARPRGRR
jgi:carbon storage regulator